MTDEERGTAGDGTADPFADRLVATLERQAGSVDGGPRFAAADVVRAGNRTLRRRRAAVVAAAAVVAGAVLTMSLIARPSALPPSTPTATSPVPPGPAASGVDFLSGDTVYRADGGRAELGLPAGRTALNVIRVASGWVVEAEGVDSNEAWFVPDRGVPRVVSKVFGSLAVSPDGRVLVVAPNGDDVRAYELPSLREIQRRAFHDGIGPVVLGVAGDVALLQDPSGDGTPTRAAVWNFRTGSLQTTGADISAWGMSDDGHALRGVGGCVDVVPVTDSLPVARTGWCGKASGGHISPDGRWASLDVPSADEQETSTVLVRAADLRAGRLSPVATFGPDEIDGLFWLTGDTFIVQTPQAGFLRCEAGDSCTAIAVPSGAADPQVVIARVAD
jgi:hypothetical protein